MRFESITSLKLDWVFKEWHVQRSAFFDQFRKQKFVSSNMPRMPNPKKREDLSEVVL